MINIYTDSRFDKSRESVFFALLFFEITSLHKDHSTLCDPLQCQVVLLMAYESMKVWDMGATVGRPTNYIALLYVICYHYLHYLI